jgi:hypothetical protein
LDCQSVRQGSVLGPWHFLVHIDGLPKAIESSGHGTYINDTFCGSPLQADDVALVSVSEKSLQSMIDICADYARKWRFTFNAGKTKIMVFGNTQIKLQKLKNRRKWRLGENALEIVDSYTHVGIKLDSSGSSLSRTTEACAKGKKTFAAACGFGINPMSPSSASKIYQTVVLPRCLYGCELWSNMSYTETQGLEVMHRFAAKRIQHFHKRTRSVVALGMIGWHPIEVYININKLRFMGRLCRLDNKFLAKSIFISRLYMYKNSNGRMQKGFIPDVMLLILKYGLLSIVQNYMSEGIFPDKYTWKHMVKDAVYSFQGRQTQCVIEGDLELARYHDTCIVHSDNPINMFKFPQMHQIWNLVRHCRDISTRLCFAACLCTVMPSKFHEQCPNCGYIYSDVLEHLITSCRVYDTAREVFWNILINELPVACSTYLYNLPDQDLLCVLLRKIPECQNISVCEHKLITSTFARVWYCLRKESNRLGIYQYKQNNTM